MPTSDDLLLHQVHAAKLAADIAASVVSLTMIWRGRRGAGLVVHFLIPVAASAALLRTDTSRLRLSRRGRYVLKHMPPAAQAVRLAGDAVMTAGAWRRSGLLVAAGGLVVIGGWSHGITAGRG
ncbi:hypothetical protein [Mycobacterium sp.]|uniref:hypothetical protein n=1 Tax=Mycobacterium sp. TaxID=1785 RepID=UPI002C3452C3|nr:hypothetical protein [Mycobacterium sp.]HME50320.1 hypothetical protein [Mycobacterium sp.]